jgi:hypothetical protein
MRRERCCFRAHMTIRPNPSGADRPCQCFESNACSAAATGGNAYSRIRGIGAVLRLLYRTA